MRYAWWIAPVLLLDQNVAAVQWPLEVRENGDCREITVFLEEEDMRAVPSWGPAQGAPPLTVAGAIREVRHWVDASFRLKGLRIHEVELKPIGHRDAGRHWYYLVQLRRSVNGRPDRHHVAVLMNGRVIPAIRSSAWLR